MYQPPHFVETDIDVLHALIRAHPLGLLISASDDGPVANPLPFLLDADVAPHGRLRVHLARANPQWRLLADNPQTPVLVVFQGADSYVTPSWYETKRETGKVVPTWNYAIVQVRGRARVIEDKDWLAGQIAELTATHEAEPPGALASDRCARRLHRLAAEGHRRTGDRHHRHHGQVEGQPEPAGKRPPRRGRGARRCQTARRARRWLIWCGATVD